MGNHTVRIGTRGSLLALWQARWVQAQLQERHPGLVVELEIIKTQGDKILDVPLALVGGKGLFVKELEEAILAGRVDLAVHSMKDVPTELPEGLGLGAILPREDPRDALLATRWGSLAALPPGARVGSSSLRRQSQLKQVRPDLEVISLRGNVNTRIDKLVQGEFDAIVLAAAGVKRLGSTERVVEYLDPEVMLPAIGQGAVGIEARANDERIARLIAVLDDQATHLCVRAERAFLAKLEGGCQVPIAAHARLQGETLHLTGLVAALDGQEVYRRTRSGPAQDGVQLGRTLAQEVADAGGARILAEVYQRVN